MSSGVSESALTENAQIGPARCFQCPSAIGCRSVEGIVERGHEILSRIELLTSEIKLLVKKRHLYSLTSQLAG